MLTVKRHARSASSHHKESGTPPANVIPMPSRSTFKLPCVFEMDVEPKTVQTGKRVMRIGDKLRFYSDAKKVAYENLVATVSRAYRPPKPLTGPLHVRMVFVCSRPLRRCRKSDPSGELYIATRPDLDNMAKGTIDGLSKARFWKDDSQIAKLQLEKIFHHKGGAPCIRVWINTLMEEKSPGNQLPGL